MFHSSSLNFFFSFINKFFPQENLFLQFAIQKIFSYYNFIRLSYENYTLFIEARICVIEVHRQNVLRPNVVWDKNVPQTKGPADITYYRKKHPKDKTSYKKKRPTNRKLFSEVKESHEDWCKRSLFLRNKK